MQRSRLLPPLASSFRSVPESPSFSQYVRREEKIMDLMGGSQRPDLEMGHIISAHISSAKTQLQGCVQFQGRLGM